MSKLSKFFFEPIPRQISPKRNSTPPPPRQLLSRHHESRPTRADASRIKLDGVQARLYVVRAGDGRVRKSAGCAVSPVRVSRHSITSSRPFLASLTSRLHTAVPRFSTRPSVSTGSSVTLQNFTSIQLTWILVTRPDLAADPSRNPVFERV